LVLVAGLGCVYPRLEPAILELGEAEVAELPAEFDLLCWNIHKQRKRTFTDELRRFGTGIELFVLQEAIEDPRAWTLTPGARTWTLVIAFEYGRDRVATGVATGSAAAPVDERALLSPVREPVIRTPKSTLLSWIEIVGSAQPLLLVNLHAINFRMAPALAAQLQSLDAVIEAHRGPLVVAGDFNTWSRRRRVVVEAFVARHALMRAFPGITEVTRFDQVYLRGLVVRDARVLQSRSSDHDALRIELALPVAPRKPGREQNPQ
jgi:endonuclease/exonuclease/phosphatase (EEP) superfamily protein YafD